MLRRLTLILAPLILMAGCTSTEPFEEQIRVLTWKLSAAEEAAELSAIDCKLAERETDHAKTDQTVLKEKLALAYDGLRDAHAKIDEGLQDRLTALSESTVTPGERLSISKYGGVVLKSSVLFAPGKHELTKAGRAALEPLAQTLMGQDYDGYDIELAGHTDDDRIRHTKRRYRDNWDLAAMRANSVRRFLNEKGISEERLLLSSWGFSRPFGGADKAKNRRVEVMLRKKVKALPASSPR